MTRIGRPTDYTPELGAEICERIAGGETLIDICDSNDAMPHRTTVLRWQYANPAFRIEYQRARELQTETFADRIMHIAADESRDYYVDGNGVRRSDNTGVQRDKLRCDTMKFLMSCLNGRYAPRAKQEVSGPDGGPIPVINLGLKSS